MTPPVNEPGASGPTEEPKPRGADGGFIRLAIGRPVSVMVGVILVVLFGFLAVADLPIQLTPDVTVPVISVSTFWPGATPAEIEADILEEQEEALKSLPGLVQMTSQARRNQGEVTLELEVGAPLQEALVRVSNLLSQVPDYPATARQPVISTANSSGPPLAVSIIQSDPPGAEVAEYRTWVAERILPRLERIRGEAQKNAFLRRARRLGPPSTQRTTDQLELATGLQRPQQLRHAQKVLEDGLLGRRRPGSGRRVRHPTDLLDEEA